MSQLAGSPQGQAVLQRMGYVFRTPAAAAGGVVGALVGVWVLQPRPDDPRFAIPNPYAIPSPFSPPPVLDPLPGFTPHTPDPRDGILSTPNNGPVITPPSVTPIPEPIGPLVVSTPNNGPVTSPPMVTPLPVPQGPIVLMNTGFGQHNGIPVTSDTKTGPQIIDRGWTDQSVRDAIARGPTGTAQDTRRPITSGDVKRNDPATVYGGPGNYVVVNDRTGEIVQVSGKNDPDWADDGRIRWNPSPPPSKPGK